MSPSSVIEGRGRLSLHEALLFEAGAIDRLGSVPDGSTVSDSAPDERARQMSISTSFSSLQWRERKVNLLDTPGEPSFVADALGALRVCESAVFVVNGVMGVEVATTRLWQRAAELDLARMLFVNMLDRERADFYRTLEQLKGAFGQHVVATEIPIGAEHELEGVIDLVDMTRFQAGRRAAGRLDGDPDPRRVRRARERVPREVDGRGQRGIRRADGALSGGRGDRARGDRGRAEGGHEPRQDLPGRVRRGHAQPRHDAPAGCDRRGSALARQARRASGQAGSTSRVLGGPRPAVGALSADPEGELYAYVFKTRADPFAGRVNLLRVYQGTLRADSHVSNLRAHAKERIGQLMVFAGARGRPSGRARAGRHRCGRQAEGDTRRGLAERRRRASGGTRNA